MDINRDEIRRQLHDADLLHQRSQPLLTEALDRAAHTGTGATAFPSLLGVPSRRGFLKIGGLAVSGAAVLAACTPEPVTVQIPQAGTSPTTIEKATYQPEGDIPTDLTLLRVGQSIERLAVAAYTTAIDSGVLPPEITDVAKLFRDHHNAHWGALATTIKGIGGESFDDANPVLVKLVLDPAAESIKAGNATLESLLELAIALEDTAAQTYANSASLLTTASLRQAVMTIGATEARHVALLLGVQKPGSPQAQAPFAFGKTADAVKPRNPSAVAVGSGNNIPTATTSTPPRAVPTGTGQPAGTSTTR